MSQPQPPDTQEKMPAGVHNVYWFEVFNTGSWAVILQSPMILFLTHLNASAVVLAIAGCLSPVLNILQIPAAPFVEKVGYQKFVLAGWTSRSFLVIGMAIIAFLPVGKDTSWQIFFFILLILLYNILRGISVCGILPWFTYLVPEALRGGFLARDQFAGNVAQVISYFIYASFFATGNASEFAFGLVFMFSAICAFTSLYFLRLIPDVPVDKSTTHSGNPPWLEMLFYPPFFKYIIYVIVMNFASGAGAIFWIPMFKEAFHLSYSNVLIIAAYSVMVSSLSLLIFGSLIDRVGNKPILILGTLFQMIHYAGWATVVSGALPFNMTTLTIQTLTAGFAGSLTNLGNTRMVMGIVPTMGRAHFLALYSVAANLTMGLAPLCWGHLMDLLHYWHYSYGIWTWNRYSILYVTLALIVAAGLFLISQLSDPGAMTWEAFVRELLVKTPRRGISRIISRLRGPGL